MKLLILKKNELIGRMPCIDISDDIVQSGREILEKVILIISYIYMHTHT